LLSMSKTLGSRLIITTKTIKKKKKTHTIFVWVE